MRLIIAAVGRLRDGAERELFARYRDRFEAAAKQLAMQPVAWHETGESRSSVASKRREEEGAALLRLARDADFVIALDERGQMLSSAAFAKLLGKIRDDGA